MALSAPPIKTVLPASPILASPRCRLCSADCAASGMAAAAVKERVVGLCAVVEAVLRAYSAIVPRVGESAYTSSPSLKVVTEGPMATTVPARSWPIL